MNPNSEVQETMSSIPEFEKDEADPIKDKYESKYILLGRERAIFNHSGNKKFRAIVHHNVHEYINTSQKSKKTALVRKIFEDMDQSGFRFLKKDCTAETGWHIISDEDALGKICHALRDRAKEMRRSAARSKNKTETTTLKKETSDERPTEKKVDQSDSMASPPVYTMTNISSLKTTNIHPSNFNPLRPPSTIFLNLQKMSNVSSSLKELHTHLKNNPLGIPSRTLLNDSTLESINQVTKYEVNALESIKIKEQTSKSIKTMQDKSELSSLLEPSLDLLKNTAQDSSIRATKDEGHLHEMAETYKDTHNIVSPFQEEHQPKTVSNTLDTADHITQESDKTTELAQRRQSLDSLFDGLAYEIADVKVAHDYSNLLKLDTSSFMRDGSLLEHHDSLIKKDESMKCNSDLYPSKSLSRQNSTISDFISKDNENDSHEHQTKSSNESISYTSLIGSITDSDEQPPFSDDLATKNNAFGTLGIDESANNDELQSNRLITDMFNRLLKGMAGIDSIESGEQRAYSSLSNSLANSSSNSLSDCLPNSETW